MKRPQLERPCEHEAAEGDEVQAGPCGGVALVVFDEPAEASGLGKGALHNPAPGQQHEAALGLGLG